MSTPSTKTIADFAEQILEEVNRDTSRWKTMLTIVLLCTGSAFMGAVVTSQIFLLAVPDHRCYTSAFEENGTYNKSNFTSLSQLYLNQSIPFEHSTEVAAEFVRSQCLVYKQIPYEGTPIIVDKKTQSLLVEQCTTNKWVYDYSIYPETLISETFLPTQLDLVCEGRAYMAKVPEMMFFIGVMIGSLVFGYCSDAFGRRLTLIVSCIVHVLGGASASLYSKSDDGLYYLYNFLSVVMGILGAGVYQTGFVTAVEIVPKKYRTASGAAYASSYSIGEALAALMAMARLPWRYYNVLIHVPLLPVALLKLWLVPESVRWLLSTKPDEKLLRNLQRMSSKSQRSKYNQAWLQQIRSRDRLESGQIGHSVGIASESINNTGTVSKFLADKTNKQSTVADTIALFRHARTRANVLILCYTSFVCVLVYFGISLDMAILGGNPYVNCILIAMCEIPGNIITLLLIDRYGRRPIYAGAFALSGIFIGTLGVIPFRAEFQWPIILLAAVGKCAVTSAYLTSYIYAAELVPTRVRTVALGFCGAVSHIGGIAAPAIALLADIYHPLPFWLFGLSAIIGAALCYALPETNGRLLPETFEDMERMEGEEKQRGTSHNCYRRLHRWLFIRVHPADR